MNCPNDGTTLVMSERQGIEIDYCPQCRGVWLDRGELDKLIERSAEAPGPAARPSEPPRYEERRDHHESRDHHDRPHKKHRKESFLGDMFDF